MPDIYGNRFAGFQNPAFAPRTTRFGSQPRSGLMRTSQDTQQSDTPAVPGSNPTPAVPPAEYFDPNIGPATGLGSPNPGSTAAANAAVAQGSAFQNPNSFAPTAAQVAANPTGYGPSFNPANQDPNITAALAGYQGQGSLSAGSTPRGYGTAGFDMSTDPAYAGSYNASIPDPNVAPAGSTPLGGGAARLPWGGTWFAPGSVTNNSDAEYQAWRRRTFGA